MRSAQRTPWVVAGSEFQADLAKDDFEIYEDGVKQDEAHLRKEHDTLRSLAEQRRQFQSHVPARILAPAAHAATQSEVAEKAPGAFFS
jgi:hypothetical protein